MAVPRRCNGLSSIVRRVLRLFLLVAWCLRTIMGAEPVVLSTIWLCHAGRSRMYPSVAECPPVRPLFFALIAAWLTSCGPFRTRKASFSALARGLRSCGTWRIGLAVRCVGGCWANQVLGGGRGNLRADANNPLASAGCGSRMRRRAPSAARRGPPAPALRSPPAASAGEGESPSLPVAASHGLGPTRGYSDRLLTPVAFRECGLTAEVVGPRYFFAPGPAAVRWRSPALQGRGWTADFSDEA